MRVGRWLSSTALGAAALAITGRAGADGFFNITRSLVMPVGITLAGSPHSATPGGFVFGGELSLVDLRPGFLWAGGYVDVVRDFGANSTRFSFGPEAGFGPFGIDVAYIGQARDGDSYHQGFCGRLMLAFPVVTLYGRLVHLFDDPAEDTFGEFGVTLKYPFVLKEFPEKKRPEASPSPARPSAPVKKVAE